jgi:outer membrane protein
MKFKFKKVFFHIVLLLLLSAPAIAQQSGGAGQNVAVTTLDQVWQMVQANSTDIDIKKKQVLYSESRIKVARSERLPEIQALGEYARVSNMPVYQGGLLKTPLQAPVLHTYYKFGADAYFNLYQGKKTSLEISKRQVETHIAGIEAEELLSDLKLSSASYYLDLQRSLAFRAFLIRDIEAQRKQLTQIMTFQRNGIVLKSDVLRAELKLNKQTLAIDQLDNDIAIARQNLSTLTGTGENKMLMPVNLSETDSIATLPYGKYLEQAQSSAYLKRISGQTEKISAIDLQAVRGDILPKIGLFANYSYSYPQIFLYPYSGNIYGFGMVGIKASLNISSFYKNSFRQNSSKLDLEIKKLQTVKVQEELRDRVYRYYLRFRESQKRVGVARINVKHAFENQRIISNTYYHHLSLVTDLLDADAQVLQSQFDLADSKIAAQFQYFQLLNAVGTL